jgi:hypothetical protein
MKNTISIMELEERLEMGMWSVFKGAKGEDGKPGEPGKVGENGKDGEDGKSITVINGKVISGEEVVEPVIIKDTIK